MQESQSWQGMKATETAAGVRCLRELWGIPKDDAPRDMPPPNVNTNIYQTRTGAQRSRRFSSHH